MNEYQKQWRKEHPNYQKELYERGREFCQNYKRWNPCVKCGETDYRCLEFHHLEDKTIKAMADIYRFPLWRIQLELDKCEILCANCHRKLHFPIEREFLKKENEMRT